MNDAMIVSEGNGDCNAELRCGGDFWDEGWHWGCCLRWWVRTGEETTTKPGGRMLQICYKFDHRKSGRKAGSF